MCSVKSDYKLCQIITQLYYYVCNKQILVFRQFLKPKISIQGLIVFFFHCI